MHCEWCDDKIGCAHCPCGGERAVSQSALHPDTADACAFALDVNTNCAWCDNGRAYLHQIEGGSYKAVANTASGCDVHMVYSDMDEATKEFEIMRKLRNEYRITCVPEVHMYTHDQDVQQRLRHNYTDIFRNNAGINMESMMLPPSRLVWLERLSSGNSLGYATEENVGLDLSKPLPKLPATYDPNTTAHNMITLLEELCVLMSPSLGYFHSDVKSTNMTCKLAQDPATAEMGLKFYVVDWGFCVKFGESDNIFQTLERFLDMKDLQNPRPSQLPPELAMVSLCMLLYLNGTVESFSQFCKWVRPITLEAAIEQLDPARYRPTNALQYLVRENNINFSRLYYMKEDYKTYVDKGHLTGIWNLVTASLNTMQTRQDFSSKMLERYRDYNRWLTFDHMNPLFTACIVACMRGMFALPEWNPKSHTVPELALLQRIDIWGYSCTLGDFWNTNIVSANEKNVLCQDIPIVFQRLRSAYNNSWNTLRTQLQQLKRLSDRFSDKLEAFFSDLQDKKDYKLCDVNLLRNHDVVKQFNLFLCGQPGNDGNPIEAFEATLSSWLQICVSAQLEAVKDLPSYQALRYPVNTTSIGKKQKTEQARRCAPVVAGAKH